MNDLSVQDLAEILGTVVLETVAAISPSPSIAGERLEEIANRLFDTVQGLNHDTPMRQTLAALMQHLIKIEPGAGPV